MSLRSEVVRIIQEYLAGSKKISELPVLPTSVQNTDLIEVARSGVSYQADGSQLPSGGGGGTVTTVSVVTANGVSGSVADATTTPAITLTVQASSESQSGIIELATQAEVTTGTDDARAVTPLKLAVATRGVQDLFISAAAMWPRTTGGCNDLAKEELATSLANVQYLEFPNSGQTFAQFQIVPPRKWNNGTVTACVHWKPAASGSGDLRMGIQLASYRNDDALTGAFGTEVAVTDTFLATADFHTTADSAAITASGTVQDGNLLMCQINRDAAHGSDTLDVAARIIGITFRFTTDAAIDA